MMIVNRGCRSRTILESTTAFFEAHPDLEWLVIRMRINTGDTLTALRRRNAFDRNDNNIMHRSHGLAKKILSIRTARETRPKLRSPAHRGGRPIPR
jgi:hypothetical protein